MRAIERLRWRYEVALDPPLIVDDGNDGRLVSVSPIASSPYRERGTDRRVIELDENATVREELLNNPGNVETKLQVIAYDYTLSLIHI